MMRTIQVVYASAVLLLLLFFTPAYAEAQDRRDGRLDVYIIIDNSPSLVESYAHTADWFCRELLGQRIVGGDTLTLILASNAEVLLDHHRVDPESSIDLITKVFQDVRMQPASQRLGLSISKVNQTIATRKGGSRIPFVLLASTLMRDRSDRALMDSLAYSRVEDYPGWKLVTIATEDTRRVARGIALAFSSR